jgi:hypothetical protein
MVNDMLQPQMLQGDCQIPDFGLDLAIQAEQFTCNILLTTTKYVIIQHFLRLTHHVSGITFHFLPLAELSLEW